MERAFRSPGNTFVLRAQTPGSLEISLISIGSKIQRIVLTGESMLPRAIERLLNILKTNYGSHKITVIFLIPSVGNARNFEIFAYFLTGYNNATSKY